MGGMEREKKAGRRQNPWATHEAGGVRVWGVVVKEQNKERRLSEADKSVKGEWRGQSAGWGKNLKRKAGKKQITHTLEWVKRDRFTSFSWLLCLG
mmetsp:Transcript_3744/g.9464  ORF Transcript_3744/g.9464 Transcript_3744/m.9464 type:complete len:95 (+) Transcript_3744:198-482(+)